MIDSRCCNKDVLESRLSVKSRAYQSTMHMLGLAVVQEKHDHTYMVRCCRQPNDLIVASIMATTPYLTVTP